MNGIRSPRRATAGIMLLALVACGGSPPEPDETTTEAEIPSRVETRWTGQHEWFVEHPVFVVGAEAEFAAHLTRLDDFRPVTEGTLEVSLLDPSGAVVQRVVADAPARDGIFLPHLTPEQAGARRVWLVYRAPDGRTDEVGWSADVAADVDEVEAPPPGPDGIAFLKEQQWRIPFATSVAAIRPLRETVELPAEVELHPRHHAQVAAPARGILHPTESGLPEPGARVEAGQALARVAPSLEDAGGWQQLGVRLTEARNRLRAAELEEARARRLLEAGAVPERRLREARLELENARARHEAMERQAAVFERYSASAGGPEAPAAAELTVRAPIAGLVAEVAVTEGEPVQVERTLFRIVDARVVMVHGEVPESLLGRLARVRDDGAELPARLRPPAPDRGPGGASAASAPGDGHGDAEPGTDWIEAGPLLELGTELDPGTRTAPLRYRVDNPRALLRPGMSVALRVGIGPERPVLTIPENAVIELAGVEVVYLHLGGETFEERAIRTGSRSGGLVEVLSGLQEGDRVVTTGAYQVRLAGLSPDAAPAHSH